MTFTLPLLSTGAIFKVLIPHMPFLKIESDINSLMYFDVNNDGSKVTWARATNNKQALAEAIQS
jgi:hypothetical protein